MLVISFILYLDLAHMAKGLYSRERNQTQKLQNQTALSSNPTYALHWLCDSVEWSVHVSLVLPSSPAPSSCPFITFKNQKEAGGVALSALNSTSVPQTQHNTENSLFRFF
jgi:hypothetical protein